jgi:hypothetical protein
MVILASEVKRAVTTDRTGALILLLTLGCWPFGRHLQDGRLFC